MNQKISNGIHRAVVNPLTRQPIIQQQGNGGNPAGTQAALNAPAIRNPQARPFIKK